MPDHTKDEAGVIEAYPGIIESTDIDPLHHEMNKGIYPCICIALSSSKISEL